DVARQGRTVLFVSHNLLAVESLCGRAIWLHNGQIAGEGRPGQVISSYLQTALSTSTEHVWPISKDLETPSVQLRRVRVRPLDDASESITVHTPFMLEFEYWNSDPGAYIFISFCLYDEHDILLFDLCPPWEPEWRQKASPLGMLRSVCHIPGDLLNNGRHRVAVTVWCNNVASVEEPDALAFTIHDTTEDRHGWYGEWKGAIRPMLQWETNLPLEAPIAPLDLEFEMPHVGGEA
ncbi:MAG TPA: hypothetical protein VFU22_14560, partial [Roseiflexaceae bacterium]|nr:hypothetical protein [Roseiflexaceae bacterium]